MNIIQHHIRIPLLVLSICFTFACGIAFAQEQTAGNQTATGGAQSSQTQISDSPSPQGAVSCDECKKQLIYKRWRMRLDCLDKGGDTKTCNGSMVGDTCCHCEKHPREEPECWGVTCESECNWTQRCGKACE